MRAGVTTEPPYAKHRDRMRAKHRTCTPYRLGISVGEMGEHLRSPYVAGSLGDRLYRDGVRVGKSRLAAAKSAKRAQPEVPPLSDGAGAA